MNGDLTLMVFHLFQLIRCCCFLESCTDRFYRFIPCLKIMVRESIVFIRLKNPKETVHMIYELVE